MYSFIVVKTLRNMNARVDEDGVWECGHVKIRFKPFKRICYFGHSNPLLIDWLIDWSHNYNRLPYKLVRVSYTSSF